MAEAAWVETVSAGPASAGAARPRLVLASGSPRRLALLRQVGLDPAAVLPADIDETPRPAELHRDHARRLAREKAAVARRSVLARGETDAFVLAADTVVAVGRRILPKAEKREEALGCLRLVSGRSHRVYTAVALVTPTDRLCQRLVETRIRFKRLSAAEIEAYLASGEWRGKAGGYAVQGLAAAFVIDLIGSYSGVVGLPLHETVALLAGEGFPVHAGWRTESRE